MSLSWIWRDIWVLIYDCLQIHNFGIFPYLAHDFQRILYIWNALYFKDSFTDLPLAKLCSSHPRIVPIFSFFFLLLLGWVNLNHLLQQAYSSYSYFFSFWSIRTSRKKFLKGQNLLFNWFSLCLNLFIRLVSYKRKCYNNY